MWLLAAIALRNAASTAQALMVPRQPAQGPGEISAGHRSSIQAVQALIPATCSLQLWLEYSCISCNREQTYVYKLA